MLSAAHIPILIGLSDSDPEKVRQFLSCLRKKKHSTLGDAMNVALANSSPKFRMRVYPCEFCKGFHLAGPQNSSGKKSPRRNADNPLPVR